MTSFRHALLGPLFAVLAVLLGLTGSASGAFNRDATKTHYGNFLAPAVHAPDLLALQSVEGIKENRLWIYDSALGVPVYVTQNPWTKFDPLGLTMKGLWPDKTKAWIAKNIGTIRARAEENGISPVSLAMAMGEEHSRRGRSDKLQDALAGYSSNLANQTTSALHKAKSGHGRNADVGPANVNMDSALTVLRDGEFSLSEGGVEQGLADYLLTDEGTIDISARLMKKASEQMVKYLENVKDPDERAALETNAWREGPENLSKRIEANRNEDPDYVPSSGNDPTELSKRSFYIHKAVEGDKVDMSPEEYQREVIDYSKK